MDSIKMEKARETVRYKKIQLLQNLFQYLLTAFVLAMAISKAFPPCLFSSMKLFFSVSLPSVGAFFISPKCLFIVCNAIVIFLYSKSKFAGTSTSSLEIYDEYVRHQRNLWRQSSIGAKEEEKRLHRVFLGEGNEEMIKEGENKMVQVLEEKKREEKEEKKQEEEDHKEKEDAHLEEEEKEEDDAVEEEEEKEEDAEMEAEELNKRVEDFIARITKQFRLEARMHACGS